MACSDFISWDDDDMNLELLLGEYTDYENEEPEAKDFDQQTVIYSCPECSKTFKSISGFRGHVTKKHGMNVKASHYRKEQQSEKQSGGEHVITEPRSNKSDWILPSVYEEIFGKAFHNAVLEIKTNPIHNLFGRSPVSEIAEFADKYEPFKMKIKEQFAKLAKEKVNILLSVDRENLFQKIHAFRLGSELTQIEVLLSESECPCKSDIIHFLQIFIMEMTNSILSTYSKTMKTESVKEVGTLTDNDQKVIFYISGFIIHALKKKYSRIKCEPNRVELLKGMDTLIAKTCEGHFSKKFASLLVKKNRGGLKHPCDNFFALIRSLEIEVRRKTIDKLNKCEMEEELMENYMTKHYYEKLFPSSSSEEDLQINSRFLEDIVNLFITIRGFAAAKVERRKLVSKKNSNTDKKGKSFRDALKEKCVN